MTLGYLSLKVGKIDDAQMYFREVIEKYSLDNNPYIIKRELECKNILNIISKHPEKIAELLDENVNKTMLKLKLI